MEVEKHHDHLGFHTIWHLTAGKIHTVCYQVADTQGSTNIPFVDEFLHPLYLIMDIVGLQVFDASNIPVLGEAFQFTIYILG